MKVFFLLSLAAFLCVVGPPAVLGQQTSQASANDTVLRVTTRMVLVDAVVVDRAGKPVTNLTEKDFSISEDGKPQKIVSFSLHQGNKPKAQPLPPLLQPHVTTNRPDVTQNSQDTVAVLLLDGLNTPPQQQVYVKQQMLKFLAEHYNPSLRLAVVALTNNLTVLQDFTSSPILLRAALDRYLAQSPALARSGGERDLSTAQLSPSDLSAASARADLSQAGASMDPGQPANAGGSSSSIADDIAYMMRRFEKEAQNFSQDVRVSTTLGALQDVARFMSGQSGRKVLLWFSAGFPISITGPNPEDMETSREYSDQIRRTTNLLNNAHVAIYAIDAKGLTGGGIAESSQSGRDQSGRMHLGVDANKAMAKDTFERFATEDAFERVAVDTGGRYFHDRNDLDRAINDSLQESGSYYLLGYYPTEKKWDSKYRQIKVKVDHDGLEVRHRRGYFAIDPLDWRKGGHDKDFAAALSSVALPSTGVLFMARALPPARNAEVKVEFLVDASTVSFETASENRQYCNLNFEVQAFTPEGKLVKAEVQSAEAPLQQQTFERVQKQGLPMQVPINLPRGSYLLHLGVRDNRTGLFGTAELPIEVGADH
jgi:VWFA-related protein